MSPHFSYITNFDGNLNVSPDSLWDHEPVDLNVEPSSQTRQHGPLTHFSLDSAANETRPYGDVTRGYTELWFPHYRHQAPLKLRTYHDVVLQAQVIKRNLAEPVDAEKTLWTLRQTRDLVKNNEKLIMNVATGHGKSPLLARNRLSDKIHQRIRDIETNKNILKKLFTPVGQKEPIAVFYGFWDEYLAAIKNQGAAKEEALRVWQENLGGLDLGDKWKEVQDIYSIAITMPLKEWNHVCDTAGTRLIDIQYKITREFLRSHLSPDEFLENFWASRFVEEFPDSETTVVNGSVVNGTLIGVQSSSVDRLPALLENLPRFIPVILKKLLERRAALLSLISNLESINTSDETIAELIKDAREELAANLQITDQFALTPTGQVVFHNVELGVGNLAPIPLEKFVLNQSYVGIAVYQGEEDVPVRVDQQRNQTRVNALVQKLRDQAIQFAEGITHVATGADLSTADRMSFSDPSGIMSNKRVFREGSLLGRGKILTAMMEIKSRPDNAAKLESERRFRVMDFKSLKEYAIIDLAQMVVNQVQSGKPFTYPLEFSISDVDAAALSKKWIAALDAEQYDSPIMGELLMAWQWAFLQPVTSPHIRAFYIQAGGFAEPVRVLRFLTNQQPGSLMAAVNEAITILEAVEEGEIEIPYDFEDRLTLIRMLFDHAVTLMEKAKINPRDGVTIANFDELAPEAHFVFTTHYQKMQEAGIVLKGPPPGLIIFGAEMQSAKVIDSEANPILEDHMIDPNMILIRIATQIAVEDFNRWLSVHYGSEVHVGAPEWGRGDEKVFALPQHLSNGDELTDALLSEFARIHREVLAKLLPYKIHLEKKIELSDGNVLRPKRWKIKDARGRNLNVASAKENASAKSGPVWILAIDGKVLKPAILKDWSTLGKGDVTPEMGKVDMRLVAVSLDLPINPASNTYRPDMEFNLIFTRSATLVMEKDKAVKDQEYEGKIPTEGFWRVDSNTGELRQIL